MKKINKFSRISKIRKKEHQLEIVIGNIPSEKLLHFSSCAELAVAKKIAAPRTISSLMIE
ncbi:MAG TPA: hypothetical protein ACQGQI_07395 [Xylella sp.]